MVTGHRSGPSGLEQRVLARWRQLPGRASDQVIVGFSGGGDSLALAAVLGRIRPAGGPRPTLVHVDHGWRADSAAEQERAAALASALDLPFRGWRVPEHGASRHPGVGREEAARRERYLILAEAARAMETELIALAHHQDDQAETVLLHLLRGAGLAGAAGMHPARRLPVPWWALATGPDLLLWRPLLAEPRAVVRAYTAQTRLIPIDDPSNEDLGYRRNAIRRRALPELERIVPGAAAALARFAALAADDDAALTTIAAAVLDSAVSERGELRRSVVVSQPIAVRRRLVRQWAWAASGLPVVTAERTDAMLALIEDGEPGRWLEIGEGATVQVTRAGLRIGRIGRPDSGHEQDGYKIDTGGLSNA